MVGRAFRGFLNLTASGVLLLIGVLLFFGMLGTPVDSPTWKANGPGGALVILALGILGAFMTYGFYRQGRTRRSWVAAGIISALAAFAFFTVFAMWAARHF